MGPGPPGAPYVMAPNYRMRLSSLLLLEDVLVRHPKLRVWTMHAGWPLADDAIAALYAHPSSMWTWASSLTHFHASSFTIISNV
jgi:uncharacterized protein